MKKKHSSIILLAAVALYSCSKSDQQVQVSQQQFTAGTYIDSGDTLNTKNGSGSRAIKGTLKTGETYYLSGDVSGDATINAGDTLVIQSGVKIYIVGDKSTLGKQNHAPAIVVHGTLLSLGTKDAPVVITLGDATLRSNPANDPQDPNTDPAFKGWWGGIQGQTDAGDIILKWTRLEYMGGIAPPGDARAGKARYGVYTTNPKANLVLENCWLYGSEDDMVRIAGAQYELFGNTFEKVGLSAGECVNVKSGSVGDIAYNLVVGGTGNAFKSANAGGLTPEASMILYNNTIINTGYRQAKAGEGGSIDFETMGKGKSYNNILVNCQFGLAIGAGANVADTANVRYGYTYNYGDKYSFTSQVLPAGYITAVQTGDINGGNNVKPGTGNPLFVNYPLPVDTINTKFNEVNYVGGYNFRLQTASPAAKKGFTGFKADAPVKVDKTFGVTEIPAPGADMGAYQLDGTGNQH